MPSKIILKKSSVAAKVPVAADLDFGELAINYTDGKLYFKKADTTIDSFTTASAAVTSVGGNTGAVTDTQLLTSIKNVDGTGSGLDADTLDGNHASAFYLASNPSGYTTNTGTVTSVSGTGTVSGLTLSGTVTTTGNLTLGGTLAVTPSNFASQTANTVLAAPNGAAGVPTFRTLVAADLPSHNHTSLTGVTSIGFAAEGSDSASISTTISSTSTFFDFNLTDDNNNDEWRWRFTPSGATVYNAMRLVPTTNTTANLVVSGSVSAGGTTLTGNTGTVTSVSATAGTGISITGSPITTSGTLTITNTAPNVTTDISITHNASNVVVNSSDGADGTINAATTTVAGVMSSADKTKLDGIAAGATNVTNTNQLTNGAGYITSSGSISGSSGSVTGLTLTNSSNGINPDNVTQNQLGYNISVSLFGQTDGGLYSSAYSSSWIHQIYGDFRTGQIAIRGKNNGVWQSWRTVWDSTNLTNLNQLTNGPGYTTNTGTVTSVATSGSVNGLTLTGGTITTSGTITLGGTLSASIDNITDEHRLFNNMGQNHATTTDFNLVSDFGVRYVQGTTNGPTGVAGHQFYGFTLGLGNDYAYSSYASQFYWPRIGQGGNRYIYIRDREGGTWGSWGKIYAGYADSAGTADTITGTYSGTLTSSQVTTALGYTPYNSTNPNGYTTNTGTVTSVSTGTGLTGGPITTSGTISLANTAVTAGSYTNANITVDAQGRITAASSGSSGTSVTISDDTTTNATRYPVFEDITSGTMTTAQVSSTKFTFNPSTGTLTATVVSASSDERLKSEWNNLSDDYIYKLSEVKIGTYKHSLDDSNSRQIGASAQSVKSFCPEGVITDENGYLSIAYGNVALASVVKLSQKVIEQEKRIEQLEYLVAQLMNKLA